MPRNDFIDLRSDTQSHPTDAMRQAMATAEVGDEQKGDDPTVNALCARVAELTGKEAAMFLPSGTMCNQVAILVHCQPGDEIIAAEVSHIIRSEGAGASALAGTQVLGIPSHQGVFSGADVDAAARKPKRNAPRSRLVEIEQTVNYSGGNCWPVEAIKDVGEAAHRNGLKLHMDGARLLNAVMATGTSAVDFCRPCDTAWIDLSKGLGCPIGGVLAGDAEFIEDAWRWKHRLGGAMRQAGIIAAAGLHALDHHVERLADDHANAKHMATRLADISGVSLDPPDVETNLVFFDISGTGRDAAELEQELSTHGVGIGASGPGRMRAVTHLDVDRAQVDAAMDILAGLLAGD